MNSVTLIGRLGADPEVRYTPDGVAVANFSLATTEKWTKDGQKFEKTEWHRLVAWRKTAEIAGEYLFKGSQVAVQGKIETREWEDKDGNKRYTTEIVVRNLEMLGTPKAQKGPPPADSGPGDEDIPF